MSNFNDREDNSFIYRYRSLEDKVNKAKVVFEPVFTDYLTPEEQVKVGIMAKNNNVICNFSGGIEGSERKIACLMSQQVSEYTLEIEYPITILKIAGNLKFENLTHRDYLGSILSLGIKKEKIGDINVLDDGAEISVLNEIDDYIIQSITKIKRTGVKISVIDINDAKVREQEFKPLVINIASLRLDAVVSGVCNVSRSQALNMCKAGNVKLNHIINYSASEGFTEGDLISIRGYGRFKVDKILGTTRSGRMKININKFV